MSVDREIWLEMRAAGMSLVRDWPLSASQIADSTNNEKKMRGQESRDLAIPSVAACGSVGDRHNGEALSAEEFREESRAGRPGIREDPLVAVTANFGARTVAPPGKAHAGINAAQVDKLKLCRQRRGKRAQ